MDVELIAKIKLDCLKIAEKLAYGDHKRMIEIAGELVMFCIGWNDSAKKD